jgi:hypothetical protein
LAKPTEPVKVEVPVVRERYEAPIMTTVPTIDVAQLYANSIDVRCFDASECAQRLDIMVRAFFEKLNLPVNCQLPVLSVRGGVLIMKGLLFSPAMVEAFSSVGPGVRLIEPDYERVLLYQVEVDLDFFEGTVLGVLGSIMLAIRDASKDVVEA